MDDSTSSPIQESEYNSPNWMFKCKSWQYDALLERYRAIDPDAPDTIIIELRYIVGGRRVLPVTLKISAAAVFGRVSEYQMERMTYDMEREFEQMNVEGSYVSFQMVQEVMNVTHIMATMPRNAGRKAFSFVYEVTAFPCLSEVVFGSLTRVKFLGENSETQICAVCMENISEGDEVIWLPCDHVYHDVCIIPWLGKKPTCPTCIRPLE